MFAGSAVDAVRRGYRRNSTEIKLFITFFLIATVFVQWMGANENSRLDVARSMAEHGDLDIDEYANNTRDKIYYQGAIYSDKPPVSSLIGVPAYLIAKKVAPPANTEGAGVPVLQQDDFSGGFYYFLDQPRYLAFAQIFFVLLVGVLPGALLVVFMKRFVERYYSTETAVWTAVLFGFGTQIFFYSTLGQATILGAFFAFLAFYYATGGNRTRAIFSGIFSSLAVSSVYYVVLLPVVILAFKLYERKMKFVYKFLGGTLIGALPIVVYGIQIAGLDFVSFLAPFLPGASSATFPLADMGFVGGAKGVPFLSIKTFLRDIPFMGVIASKLLFFPSGGLLFYSPLLVLSFLAFKYREKFSDASMFYIPVFYLVTTLIINASIENWHAGASYGPRYLVPVIPFFIIHLAHFVSESGIKTKIASYVLAAMGGIQSLVGSHGGLPVTIEKKLLTPQRISVLKATDPQIVLPDFDLLIASLQPYSREIYRSQLGELLSTGPIYRIVTRPLTGMPLDIRSFMPGGRSEIVLGAAGDKFATYSTGWLFVPLIATIIGIVWWREIGRLSMRGKKVLAGIFIVMVFLPAGTGTYVMGEGVTPARVAGETPDGVVGQEGEILVRTGEGVTEVGVTFSRINETSRRVRLMYGDEEMEDVNVRRSGVTRNIYFVAEEGRTRPIRIVSDGNCTVLSTRDGFVCGGVAVSGFEVSSAHGKASIDIDESLQGLEIAENRSYRWEDQNASFSVFADRRSKLALRFNASRFDQAVFYDVNGENGVIERYERGIIRREVRIEAGVNGIMASPTISIGREATSANVLKSRQGFYEWEEGPSSRFRWLKNNISAFVFAEEEERLVVEARGVGFNGNDVSVAADGQERPMNLTSRYRNVTMAFALNEGRNELRIRPTACTRPSEVSDREDDRCLSAAFTKLDLSIVEAG